MATTGQKQQEPIHVRLLKWLTRGDTGALVPEIDEASSEDGGYVENAAHSTDATCIAAAGIIAGNRFMLKNLNITNEEAYNVILSLYDGPSATGTLIDRFIIGAYSTMGITDLTGYEFTTSVIFITTGQGAAAWAAGTSMRVGGIMIPT